MTGRSWPEPWGLLLRWGSWGRPSQLRWQDTAVLCTELACCGCPVAGAVGGAASLRGGCEGAVHGGGTSVVQRGPHYRWRNLYHSLDQSSVHAVLSCLPNLYCASRGGQLRMGGLGLSRWHWEGSVFSCKMYAIIYPKRYFCSAGSGCGRGILPDLKCSEETSPNLAFLIYLGLDCITRKIVWKEVA